MSQWDIDPPAKDGPPSSQQPSGAPPGDLRPVHPTSAAASAAGRRTGGDAGPAPEPAPATGSSNSRAPKRRLVFSSLWALLAVALLVGILAGFYIGRARYSPDAAALDEATARVGELQAALTASEDRNWTYYRLNKAYQEQLEQNGATSTTAVPGLPGGAVYGDGVYLVGEDIPAGTYDGTVNGGVGYWARLKGADGAIASIIENGIPKGPFVLTIVPADRAVELRGVTLTPR